ncbi:hypothetical protein [Streptomyces sp. NPDC057910]|uniref:hypothetical protein n=1 Tax=Streptomyces sp. NPDC057910 TaxID=3346278 RepID=UPI0036E79D52
MCRPQREPCSVVAPEPQAKSGDGPVHSARIYKLAKDSAVKARTQAINQLKAVLVIADPALRERLSTLGNVNRPGVSGDFTS